MDNLPWLTYVTLAIPLVFALLGVWKGEADIPKLKTRSTVYVRSIFTVLLLFVTVVSALMLEQQERDAQEARGESKSLLAEISEARSETIKVREELADARSQRDRIEGRLGSEEATKRFLDAQRTLIDILVNEKTETAVDKFFGSLDERRRLREEIQRANRKLLAEYEIRFRPVYDLVLKTFDSWLEGAKERGVEFQSSSQDLDPVGISLSRGSRTVREAIFASGTRASIVIQPASVEDGQLTRLLVFRLRFSMRGAAPDYVSIVLGEDEFIVGNNQKGKLSFEGHSGKGNMPMSDSDFVDTVNTALNQFMAYSLEWSSP